MVEVVARQSLMRNWTSVQLYSTILSHVNIERRGGAVGDFPSVRTCSSEPRTKKCTPRLPLLRGSSSCYYTIRSSSRKITTTRWKSSATDSIRSFWNRIYYSGIWLEKIDEDESSSLPRIGISVNSANNLMTYALTRLIRVPYLGQIMWIFCLMSSICIKKYLLNVK